VLGAGPLVPIARIVFHVDNFRGRGEFNRGAKAFATATSPSQMRGEKIIVDIGDAPKWGIANPKHLQRHFRCLCQVENPIFPWVALIQSGCARGENSDRFLALLECVQQRVLNLLASFGVIAFHENSVEAPRSPAKHFDLTKPG
jgi:hypothetical protein